MGNPEEHTTVGLASTLKALSLPSNYGSVLSSLSLSIFLFLSAVFMLLSCTPSRVVSEGDGWFKNMKIRTLRTGAEREADLAFFYYCVLLFSLILVSLE